MLLLKHLVQQRFKENIACYTRTHFTHHTSYMSNITVYAVNEITREGLHEGNFLGNETTIWFHSKQRNTSYNKIPVQKISPIAAYYMKK